MSNLNDWEKLARVREEELYKLEKDISRMFLAGFVIGVIATVAVFIIL